VEQLSLAGDHELETGEIMESPRAASEQVLMTPRTAVGQPEGQGILRGQFSSDPGQHGAGDVCICSSGATHASMGSNGQLFMWDASSGEKTGATTLALPPGLSKTDKKLAEALDRAPTWMGFDNSGSMLGVLRPAVGLWVCTKDERGINSFLLASGGDTSRFSWLEFSTSVRGLLAVGTSAGRIWLYSQKSGKLTMQADGRHPGGTMVQINCGDWLGDGRLAVASHRRLKVSMPMTDGGDWSTFSKFYIGKMIQKIPLGSVNDKNRGGYDTTPRFVAVSKGSPPYIALSLGDKVVTVMDYSGLYKEEGFFIPLDYGQIIGMTWTTEEVLIVGLSNGYIVTISAPLLMRQRKNQAANVDGRKDSNAGPNSSARAMTTTRIFQHYLAALCDIDGAPAALGDTSVKMLQIDMQKWGSEGYLSIPADVAIQGFTMSIGVSLKSLVCRRNTSQGDSAPANVFVSTTNGLVHGFSLPGGGAASWGA